MMKSKLTIKVSAPYRKWFNGGARLELEVDEGTRLEDMLSLLAARYPSLRPALGLDEEALWGRVIFIQNDRLLRRDDVIAPEGEIEILPPVAGGR
ncbi:MAG: MoaD/ThiS family protein [Anaerolineae bacterium]